MPAPCHALPTIRRVVIVGTTGSGKTTLARQLADHLGCPHVEMDALHWTPDWTPSAVFQAEVAAALSGACWVTDGNYGAVRDLIWQQADTLVWLDYPLPVVMWRLWRRSVQRLFRHEEIWPGVHESWRMTFFSRQSILLWQLQTFRRRKRQYSALTSLPKYAHLHVVHLRSPRAAREWLASFNSASA